MIKLRVGVNDLLWEMFMSGNYVGIMVIVGPLFTVCFLEIFNLHEY